MSTPETQKPPPKWGPCVGYLHDQIANASQCGLPLRNHLVLLSQSGLEGLDVRDELLAPSLTRSSLPARSAAAADFLKRILASVPVPLEEA